MSDMIVSEDDAREICASMNELFEMQIQTVRNKAFIFGLKVLVSERMISLVREPGNITTVINTLGLHSLCNEISFNFGEAPPNLPSAPSSIMTMQRKLMALVMVEEMLKQFAKMLKDARDVKGIMSNADKTQSITQLREHVAEMRGERKIPEHAERLIEMLRKLNGQTH